IPEYCAKCLTVEHDYSKWDHMRPPIKKKVVDKWDEVREACIPEVPPPQEKELNNTLNDIEAGWTSPTKITRRRQTMPFTNTFLDLDEFSLLSVATVKNSFGSLRNVEILE
ncbi:hypothetical protein HAX54_035205, partial [Datura stramonium]|nr:hypothetical protein [Datura stramonium]